jgi:hypothetical protein
LGKFQSGSPTTAQLSYISLKKCSAINSILHVQQSIQPLAEEIGLYRLSDAGQRNDNNKTRGPTQDEDATIQNVNEKLDEIFYTIVCKAI